MRLAWRWQAPDTKATADGIISRHMHSIIHADRSEEAPLRTTLPLFCRFLPRHMLRRTTAYVTPQLAVCLPIVDARNAMGCQRAFSGPVNIQFMDGVWRSSNELQLLLLDGKEKNLHSFVLASGKDAKPLPLVDAVWKR